MLDDWDDNDCDKKTGLPDGAEEYATKPVPWPARINRWVNNADFNVIPTPTPQQVQKLTVWGVVLGIGAAVIRWGWAAAL